LVLTTHMQNQYVANAITSKVRQHVTNISECVMRYY